MKEGRIIKAVSGFYYVQTDEGVYACKGRGVFRKKAITPLVGDHVTFDITGDKEGYITKIHKRLNMLTRPPIANVHQAVLVSSAKEPDFSPLLLDRFLVVLESHQIKPIIFITKIDLLSEKERDTISEYAQEYEHIGYDVHLVDASAGSDLSHLEHIFANKVSVIAGQSGVGKSSLLNALNLSLVMETDVISKRLGRGKHTTRNVELVEIGEGLVADTPGFSSVDFNHIEEEALSECFPEINEVGHACKFRGCLHDKEPACAVKAAVEAGPITPFRYNHYLRFLEEIQSRKPRY